MDSGLARFAVLIVLFFLLTGDLTGMVKHLFQEAGYGGKQQHKTPGTEVKPQSMDKGSTDAEGSEQTDSDLQAFGKCIILYLV